MVKKTVRSRPRPPKWSRRPAERPQEILDAALAVFAARGYAATRLADVAAAAGVTKGTIYYYFKDKDALLVRLVAAHDQELFAHLEHSLDHAAGPVSAMIRMVMRKGFLEPADEGRRLLHVVFTDLHDADPRLFARIVRRSLVAGWTLLAKLIERGKRTDEFRPDADAETAARVFTSGLIMQQLWRGSMGLDVLDPFDRDRMVDSTIELFLHSLRPSVTLPVTRGRRKVRSS